MSTQPLRRFNFGFLLTLIAAAAIGCGDSGSGGTMTVTVTITAPGIVSPNTSSPIGDNPPTLTVNNATASDGSTLTYTFQVATDQLFAGVLRQADGIAQGSGQTSWTLGSALGLGTTFGERAAPRAAPSAHGLSSRSSCSVRARAPALARPSWSPTL